MTVVLITIATSLALVFGAFFFWNRLALNSDDTPMGHKAWSHAVLGSVLASLLFIMSFVLGLWFSISRLKGLGWMLSV